MTLNPKFGVDRAALPSAPPTPSIPFPAGRPCALPLLDAIRTVRELGGSDLHVAGGTAPRARVDGVLVPMPGAVPWSPELLDAELRSLLTAEQSARFEDEILSRLLRGSLTEWARVGGHRRSA